MAHVFISYVHEDGDFASLLITEIKSAGFRSWIDSEQIRVGKDWRREIDQAINDSFALIVIASPEAKASEYVTYEWAYAIGVGVEIIPIMLRPTELHPRLEVLQYLDFTHREQRPWDRLIRRLHELERRNGSHPGPTAGTVLSESDLLEALHSQNGQTRAEVAETLGTMGSVNAVPALIKALHDSSNYVQQSAATALGRIGDPSAVSALAGTLYDRDLMVRIAVANALEQFGSSALEAMPHLIRVLQYWEPPSLQEAVVRALGAIGDDSCVPALVNALNFSKDDTANPPEAAARALLRMGTPEALAAVNQWVEETNDPGISKLADL